MSSDNALFQDFVNFSSVLTGFGTFHLRGTGQVESYLSTMKDIVGEKAVRELLAAYSKAVRDAAENRAELERLLRRDVLSDARLGPLARNVIKLWYVGIWYELPREWRDAYGESDADRTFVVSPDSYVEGLLWPAIGANPSGAKPLGYAMWATPPRIEE